MLYTANGKTEQEKALIQKLIEGFEQDMWIYLYDLHYESKQKAVAFNFPESWKNNVIIIENLYALNVYLREAKEKAPDSNVGTLLFSFVSIDKDEEAISSWTSDGVRYYGENDDRLFYLAVYGGINPLLADDLEAYRDMGIFTEAPDSPEYAALRNHYVEIVESIITTF